jgi:cytidylate kinase
MSAEPGLEHCLSFISSQLRTNGKERAGSAAAAEMRAVTISRQAGCGALAVAQKLAEYLQARSKGDAARWTVFDRNLVETVLADHELPQRLAKFMPENWTSEITDALDELFGLHPPSWLLVRQTAETILRLAKLGNVILIGRGANIITARLNHVFHVRLVAPIEKRIQRIEETDLLDRKAAQAFIEAEDRGRRRYLRKFYRTAIEDPLLYHLNINTGLISYEEAARMIGDCLLERRTVAKMAA